MSARDFFQDQFSEQELRALIGKLPLAQVFSWVSPSFRKLGVPRDALGEDRMIAMMLEQPRLIRRPLIVIDGELQTPISGADRIVSMLRQRLGLAGDV